MNPLGLADLRALAASILLYYFTGLPLARCLARGAGGPVLAWAMPCSLAVLTGGLFLARLAGLGLSGATGVLALAVLVATLGPLLFAWNGRHRGRIDVSTGGPEPVRPLEWALAGAMALVLLAAGGPLSIISDAYGHLIAIRRSLLGDAILPADIFYRGGDGTGWDPRNGFLHPLHAFACRLGGIDPVNLWRVLPAVFAPGVLFAVSRFLRAWTGPGRRGDVALLAWVLVGSGSGFLWLLRTGYPNHVAYPLSFLALAVAIDYLLPTGRDPVAMRDPGEPSHLERDRGVKLAAIGMLAFAGALIHIVASVLLLAGLGFLGAAVWFDRSARPGRFTNDGSVDRLRRVGAVFAAAVAGMAAPLVFRLLTQGRVDSTLHTHAQGLFVLGGGWLLASPVAVVGQVGFAGLLALLVLPLAVRSVPPGRRLALVFLTLGPWVCVWTPLFTPLYHVLGYLVGRLLELLPVAAVLVLALEEAARRCFPGRVPAPVWAAAPAPAGRGRSIWRLAVAGVAGALVLFTAGRAALLQPRQFRLAVVDACGEDVPRASSGAYAFIREIVDTSPSHPPVVLADPFTSYALGGLTGAHAVATLNQHGPPTDSRWRERLDDQREMFLATADSTRVDSLLTAYQVDLVFVNYSLGMPIAEFGARVDRSSMDRAQRRIEGAPGRFAVLYRGADGIVAAVRPAGQPGPEPRPGDGAPVRAAGRDNGTGGIWIDRNIGAAGADSASGAVVVSPGPFAFGAISAVNVGLPARPVTRGERITIPLAWVRTGAVISDLPLLAHIRMSTAVPPRWFARPAWSKPARHLEQRLDHSLYRFRTARPPFDGELSPARLPLQVPVPDRLTIVVPRVAALGEYKVTLSLEEETLVPNFSLRDLLRDDDSLDGPVVGRITVRD